MGQEFFVKSTNLEDKVRQILPSQGGLGAGFDLSASTQIIPIVDLTETAQGSTLRQDLQSALSHNSVTAFNINTATTINIVNNVGFFRIFGNSTIRSSTSSVLIAEFQLIDGASSKTIWGQRVLGAGASADDFSSNNIDFIVRIEAGQQLDLTSNSSNITVRGCSRQLATGTGELVNP